MSENRIAYTNRNYNDIRQSLKQFTKQYYPDLFDRLNDASLGQWLIDVLSDISDNLNYHIDRVYQETSLDSAKQVTSLQSIARTNGLKIEGRKSALCEIEISCIVPLSKDGSIDTFDEQYCPIIKRGSLFSTGTVTFELPYDVNFAEQFNENGQSDRKIEPIRNSNGVIVNYKLTKLAVVRAGQSKVFKKIISSNDIKPFMELTIQDTNVIGVESIILKEGDNFNIDPVTAEFFVDEEKYKDKNGNNVNRFFEVNNLIDQYRFGYELEEYVSNDTSNKYYNPIWYETLEELKDGDKVIGYVPTMRCVKGKWKPLKHKFITEYTDNWDLKVIFGAGIENSYGEIPSTEQEFTQYMMSRMQANDYMGVLPRSGDTLYILYRIGGGEISNIATGTLNNVIYLNLEIPCGDGDNKIRNDIRNSIRVTNTSPSYGGKDAPTSEEIKYMIKYNNSAQNRCVTLHDYQVKINQIPAKYGCPFRTGVVEENNKVVIYTLGLTSEGKLTNLLSETVAENILEYLSKYKTLNDFIEIRSGKVINVGFELTVYVDKTYDKAEVAKRIIDSVYDYLDIRKHQMGEDIFIGDLNKEISQLDGVINLVKLRCFNKTDINKGYSSDKITQELISPDACNSQYAEIGENDEEIDLDSSDMMLYSENNSMFEIKDKSQDIKVIVKTR